MNETKKINSTLNISLMTVRNYALKQGVTVAWIYRLIKEGKLEGTQIDGVQFVKVK